MIDGCMSTNRGRKDAPVVAEGAGVTLRDAGAQRAGLPRRAVETVLAQDVAGPTELILALAPSTDGTTELARELAADDRASCWSTIRKPTSRSG